MSEDKILSILSSVEDEEASYIWIIISLIEAVVIIIFNIITIITFSINRKKFSRAVYMIINLSVADMLYGCSTLITSIYNFPKEVEKYGDLLQINALLETLIVFCVAASGSSVTMIAADRVFATLSPFRYRAIDYRHRATIIGTNWCCCLGIALAHYFTPSEYSYVLLHLYVVTILVVVIIMITSYAIIFIKVRSQGQLSNRNEQSAQRREKYMAYNLMIVTFCSLLTWVPIAVVVILFQTTTISISVHLFLCAVVIQASNSFINPVIYAFRIKEFREALLRLLCKYSSRIHSNERMA